MHTNIEFGLYAGLMTRPTQGDSGFKGKEVVEAVECVTPLSYWSPFVSGDEGFELGSWSSDNEWCSYYFAKMDKVSSKEDLDFFVALDVVSASEARAIEGPSNRASLPAINGKSSRVGVSK
jgi:hypothetical protein